MAQGWIRSLTILVLALMVGSSYSNAQSAGAVGTDLFHGFGGVHSLLLPIHKSSKEAPATSPSTPGAVELGLAKQKVYNFTTVDYPGADGSIASDSNSGIVVGDFLTPEGRSGLVFSKNSYHPFGFGSPSTAINGINSSSQVVGDYEEAPKVLFGFMYDGSAVTTIAPPGAISSSAADLSDSGVIVGVYTDSSHTIHGFVDTNGAYTVIDYPGATSTSVAGINASGTMVGTYTDSANKQHGFQFAHSHFVTIDFPMAEHTFVEGINDAGAIAGTYYDVNYAIHGFTYIHGTFSQVDVAIALGTVLLRIKNNGNVVGYYADHNSESHGIIGN